MKGQSRFLVVEGVCGWLHNAKESGSNLCGARKRNKDGCDKASKGGWIAIARVYRGDEEQRLRWGGC